MSAINIEVIKQDDERLIYFNNDYIGFIWQLRHGLHPGQRPCDVPIRSGSFRAWAAESPDGQREYFRHRDEAIDFLISSSIMSDAR